MVVSASSTGGIQPIPGTQVPAPGKAKGETATTAHRNVPGAAELTEADVLEMAAWVEPTLR
ncbi:hypothetical protein D3C71_2087070 [compost metagenome]